MTGGVLAADLGGTRSRFLHLDDEGRATRIELRAAEYGSCDDAIAAAITRLRVDARQCDAAFAVAGPVHGGAVRFTNLDWASSERELTERHRFASAVMLNDVEAAAIAASAALPDDAVCVNRAPRVSGARHAVVSVGTGLGVAYWQGDRVDASEAGHAMHDPSREWEEVVSGAGFLGRPVGESCASLGRFCRDVVLVGAARGGVLLAGGVIARLGDAFDTAAFIDGFTAGRAGAPLGQVAVWRTADDDLALRGALASVRRRTESAPPHL